VRAGGESYNAKLRRQIDGTMNPNLFKKAMWGLIAGSLFIHGYLFWKDRVQIVKGYPDFTIFYSAGLIVREGLGHQLYSDATQFQVQRSFAPGVVIRQGPLPYNHPPFEALIFVPFTFLSYTGAYVAWNLLNLGMLVLAAHRLRPQINFLKRKSLLLWLIGLLAFFPIAFGMLQGQDVILLFLLQTLAFCALKRKSYFAAGLWFGLGTFKFHLILAALIVIGLGWKKFKVFFGFLAACLSLGFLSLVMIGWREVVQYPSYVFRKERFMEQEVILSSGMPNIRGLLEGWQLSGDLLQGLHLCTLIFSIALVLWAIVVSRKYLGKQPELCFAAVTCVSVLVSYHALVYDLILLVIPLLINIGIIIEQETSWRQNLPVLVPLSVLLCSPLYALMSFHLGHLNLLALAILLWLAGIWRQLKSGEKSEYLPTVVAAS
jgi:hypothetical protein